MKLSYYPGCSLHGTALFYDKSVQEVCGQLDIELLELPDWNCCGASSAHMTNHEIGMRLPIRNLLLAAELGHDVLVPCAACFQRLKAAEKSLKEDPGYWDVAGYPADLKIIHISSLLADEQIAQKIRRNIKIRLEGLKLACYYGCLSLRHPKITGVSNYEQPETLETIVSSVGAQPVSWSHRTECCSGSLIVARPDIAQKLVGDIVAAALRAGADGLVTDCPMCQVNVESRQFDLSSTDNLPVFFGTELISAALNGQYPAKQEKMHLVDADILTNVIKTVPQSREETV
jgi:heterodisulfide reductase subunit B